MREPLAVDFLRVDVVFFFVVVFLDVDFYFAIGSDGLDTERSPTRIGHRTPGDQAETSDVDSRDAPGAAAR